MTNLITAVTTKLHNDSFWIYMLFSHLSWHAYPEVNLIVVDIFMCGTANPQLALPRIKDFWQPQLIEARTLQRGQVRAHKLPKEIAAQLA